MSTPIALNTHTLNGRPWTRRFELLQPNDRQVLQTGSLPLGLGTPATTRVLFRDQYVDTDDAILDQRGIHCRIRHDESGRQWLSVHGLTASGHIEYADITSQSFPDLARGDIPLIGSLRALADPARLAVRLEVQVERHVRHARWLKWPSACCTIAVDHVVVAGRNHPVEWTDVLFAVGDGFGPSVNRVAEALATKHVTRAILHTPIRRARLLAQQQDSASLAESLQSARDCVVLLVDGPRIGLCNLQDRLSAFWGPAGGEAACREVLNATFSSRQADVRCLATLPARPWRAALEIWMAERLPEEVRADSRVAWLSVAQAIQLAGSPMLTDWRALAAVNAATYSDLGPDQTASRDYVLPIPHMLTRSPSLLAPSERWLDTDLSWLAFNARVLSLAQDPTVTPIQRLGFLMIVAGNLDEFYMVRIGALKRALQHESPEHDPLLPAGPRLLDAIRLRARGLYIDMYDTLVKQILPILTLNGTCMRTWQDLGKAERERLSTLYSEEIRPRLNPMAATANHPFPHVGTAELALAMTLRDPTTGQQHFATLTLPSELPRVIPLAVAGEWILLEGLICAHARTLFPGFDLLHTYAFRVTRSADVRYEDIGGTDVLQLVADAVERREFLPVVRLEVERGMPAEQRVRLLQAFRFEHPDRISDLETDDVIDVDGILELKGLDAMTKPVHCRVPIPIRSPFLSNRTVFEDIRTRDMLVHTPYDDFQGTVMRFLDEASRDPAVEAIKMTLYRTNDRSPILDALFRARAAGKTVIVFVELKARFDESRNIEHSKALRAAGIHVVYGVQSLKLHAKLLLVLRRDPDGLRQYAFIGTGNFNPVTASRYTDVGLFTSRAAVGEEINALMNALAGITVWPAFQELLVSPVELLPRLCALIQREIEHASAGRPAGIRLKLNGLDDTELIEALYDASSAGVSCDLSIRGICRLRPGIPDVSERIRVVSVLGEFLEHARIMHFVNGGDDEYFIGSADWRERNVRRRVEVYVPVVDAVSRARLNHLLTMEQQDPSAWLLGPDGEWTREKRADAPEATQRKLLQELSLHG